MLRIRNLSVRYGRFQALTDVTLDIREGGYVHGIIGPNGAGKSTFMDAVTGRRRPSSGQVLLDGADISRKSVGWRRRAGISRSFQKTSIFPEATIGAQLNLVARHLDAENLDKTIEVLDLAGHMDDRAGSVAYGIQRRVDVALALLGKPRVLLLDEPGAGLSTEETLNLFRHLQDLVRETGVSAIVVEHDVHAVFSCCERISVLDLGRHLMTGTSDEVRADHRVITAYLGSST